MQPSPESTPDRTCSRRDFLKLSAVAGIGIAVLPGVASATEPETTKSPSSEELNALRMPVIEELRDFAFSTEYLEQPEPSPVSQYSRGMTFVTAIELGAGFFISMYHGLCARLLGRPEKNGYDVLDVEFLERLENNGYWLGPSSPGKEKLLFDCAKVDCLLAVCSYTAGILNGRKYTIRSLGCNDRCKGRGQGDGTAIS